MKVSILVPVYGVEQYIEACAVSLFEQTYEDLEYIFVDDCSPDNSISVLQEVAQRYPQRRQQLHILHNPSNIGSGATRSVALAAATGEFVIYVDSDDALATDAVSLLCSCQERTQADIVDGAYCRLSSAGLGPAVLPYHGKSEHLFRLIIAKNTVDHHVWGRLIRKSLHTSHGIDFTAGINMAEDYGVTPRLIFYGSRAWIDDVIYHYRINDGGTFAGGLNRRNIVSFLGANHIIGDFLRQVDSQGNYRFAYETGMLQTYWSALSVGLTRPEVDAISDYQPTLPLFRLIHACCCRPVTLQLLRQCYLIIKWFYKMSLRG